MNRQITIGVLVLLALLGSGGCTVNSNHVAPTPELIAQIGLPVYPGAKPRSAVAADVTMPIVTMHSDQVELGTIDGAAAVDRFYAAQLPKALRLNVVVGIAYRIQKGATMKQTVTLIAMHPGTLIQLRRDHFVSRALSTASPQHKQ